MNEFEIALNETLINIYHSLDTLEEKMIQESENLNLSISEIHMLEAIGKNAKAGDVSISDISEELDITLPSVTQAVNKLVRKGYVLKEKSAQDGRVVNVMLTRNGRKADNAHRYFHINMVRSVSMNILEEEKLALINGINKLDAFLLLKIKKYDKT